MTRPLAKVTRSLERATKRSSYLSQESILKMQPYHAAKSRCRNWWPCPCSIQSWKECLEMQPYHVISANHKLNEHRKQDVNRIQYSGIRYSGRQCNNWENINNICCSLGTYRNTSRNRFNDFRARYKINISRGYKKQWFSVTWDTCSLTLNHKISNI